MAFPQCGYTLTKPGVSTMKEAVKQLTQLISTGPDWPYALVQLHGDACHAPIPKGRGT